MIDRIKKYYNTKVLFEVINKLKGKEVAFLSKNKATRCIKAHSYKFLLKNMAAFGFVKNPQNIYYSLANLKNMPMFSFSWEKRKKQQADFNKNFEHYVTSIDIGFDFDNHDKTKEGLDAAYNDTKTLKQVFDDYKLPYELKSSGSGFHININGVHLLECGYYDVEQQLNIFVHMIHQIKEIFNLKTLDTSVTDIRRIWKAPYSLDIKSGNVALPLTDNQFDNFDSKILNPEYVLKNIKLFKRGNLERNRTKSENLKKFIKDYVYFEK